MKGLIVLFWSFIKQIELKALTLFELLFFTSRTKRFFEKRVKKFKSHVGDQHVSKNQSYHQNILRREMVKADTCTEKLAIARIVQDKSFFF